jgi:hypothetical protein
MRRRPAGRDPRAGGPAHEAVAGTARVLPVTLRPMGGETVISYARRLSEANDLRPAAVMRALGQLSQPSGYHLLDHDAWLNDRALGRLETFSGNSRHRCPVTVDLPSCH